MNVLFQHVRESKINENPFFESVTVHDVFRRDVHVADLETVHHQQIFLHFFFKWSVIKGITPLHTKLNEAIIDNEVKSVDFFNVRADS